MADNIKHKTIIKERGFKYWLTNVFLYHYRVHMIIFFALALVAVFLILDFSDREETDFMLGIITTEPAFAWQGIFIEDIASLRGMNINSTVLVPGGADHMVYVQIMIASINDDYTLFFLGEGSRDIFFEQEDRFADWSEFGFDTTEENPRFLDISDAVLLHDIGLTGERFYAVLRRPAPQRDGTMSPQMARSVEKSAEFMRIFLAYPEGFEEFLLDEAGN